MASLLLATTLAIAPTKDFFKEWRRWQRRYLTFIEGREDSATLKKHFSGGIQQIWLPEIGVVDRCTTCHLGMTEASLEGPTVPQPFRAHPPIPHHIKEWGCVVCHGGQGRATEVAEAHQTTRAWEQPILATRFLQASCGTCHQADLPQAPQLMRGRLLLAQLNCEGCHTLPGIARPEMLGPDLSSVGTKVSRQWIYKWLKEPRTILDKDGNVTINGYLTQEEPLMPAYRLTEAELRELSAYLSVQKARSLVPYKISPAIVSAWSRNPELVSQGEVRFREMFCSTCHSLAVRRAGETKLIGGDIGSELTKVGSKVNPDWLIAWLRDPQSYLPHSRMPRYGWSDEDLYTVTQYITTKLTDTDLLSNVPTFAPPSQQEVQLGARLFLEKGCGSCHAIENVNPQKDFGPDLSTLGGKNVSELEFGASKIPHNLVSYIQAKLQDPASVNSAARMPQYNWNRQDLDAVTTALLSMRGAPATSALQSLLVPRQEAEFHPAGAFAEVYERYKCYACHKFNGYGGDLAPDLSYEGSRAQRQWLVEFMKNPQTLRPTLVLRMPQFNLSDKDAATIADYTSMVLQNDSANPAAVDTKQFTPTMATLGKQLYEEKYRCQSCHTIGGAGGYVGPDLSGAGSWLTAAWIEAWLKNPQALAPGTIEPRRDFTDAEVKALTAYLATLRSGSKSRKAVSVFAERPLASGVGR